MAERRTVEEAPPPPPPPAPGPGPGRAGPAPGEEASCAVCVAVHIRPLIDDEIVEGFQECLHVTPGQPQVRPRARPSRMVPGLVASGPAGAQVTTKSHYGEHSFTYDHVFGGNGPPAERLYENCVAPLVAGLFKGAQLFRRAGACLLLQCAYLHWH